MATKIRASRDDSRALFKQLGLPWPDVPMEFTDNVDGPFVRADIVRERELTTLQRITQPSPPSRVVPAKTEILIDEDGEEDEHVLEWRTLSDEEWRAALDALPATYDGSSDRGPLVDEYNDAERLLRALVGAAPPPESDRSDATETDLDFYDRAFLASLSAGHALITAVEVAERAVEKRREYRAKFLSHR